jgi:hypothetical protein
MAEAISAMDTNMRSHTNTPSLLAEILADLEEAKASITLMISETQGHMEPLFRDKETHMTVGGRALIVSRNAYRQRTKVDREGLTKAVMQHAAHNPEVDALTGEVATPERTALNLVSKHFRLEPRWSGLEKELGLTDEDYAECSWATRFKVGGAS